MKMFVTLAAMTLVVLAVVCVTLLAATRQRKPEDGAGEQTTASRKRGL